MALSECSEISETGSEFSETRSTTDISEIAGLYCAMPYGTKDRFGDLPIRVATPPIVQELRNSAKSAPCSPRLQSRTELMIRSPEPYSAPGSPVVRMKKAPPPPMSPLSPQPPSRPLTPKIVVPIKPWQRPNTRLWESAYNGRPVWEVDPIPKVPPRKPRPAISMESKKTPEPPLSPTTPLSPEPSTIRPFVPTRIMPELTTKSAPASPMPTRRSTARMAVTSPPPTSLPGSPLLPQRSSARIERLVASPTPGSLPGSPLLNRSIRKAPGGKALKARQQQIVPMPDPTPVPVVIQSQLPHSPPVTIRSTSRGENRTDSPLACMSPTPESYPYRGARQQQYGYRSTTPPPEPVHVPIERLKGVSLAMPAPPPRPVTPSPENVCSKTLPIKLRRSKSSPADSRHNPRLYRFPLANDPRRMP